MGAHGIWRAAVSSAAARMRWHRARARDGKRVFHLALDEVAIEALLTREGVLADDVEHDPRAVDAALAAFIGKLCEWGG